MEMPTISTQVSDADVSVGDAFHDVATVRGKVGRGWYVTFTAYEAVAGDTEPNGNAGKILDEARVDITDDQADNSNVKSEFDVTSPDAHSWRSGTVYWVASLHTASGAVVDKGKLGEETEKIRVRGGGIITSHAQAMGAVGGQLYDEITIYDETVGHEGTGNGNLHDNAGMIPDDSYVIVRLWRNDGHNGQTKGQMVGQIRRDVNQENFIPFEDGGEASTGAPTGAAIRPSRSPANSSSSPNALRTGTRTREVQPVRRWHVLLHRHALRHGRSGARLAGLRTVRRQHRDRIPVRGAHAGPEVRHPNGPRSGSASTRRTTPTRPSAATTC